MLKCHLVLVAVGEVQRSTNSICHNRSGALSFRLWLNELESSLELVNALRKTMRVVFAAARKCLRHPGEAFLLFRMAWWIAFLSAATKFLSLPRALELVSGRESKDRINSNDELPNQLARSIDLLLGADLLFLKPICWKRAAVLRRYLSHNGIPTQIVFGVRKETEGEVDGHAWLERDGKPLLEKKPPEYVVTYSFPCNSQYDSELVFTSK